MEEEGRGTIIEELDEAAPTEAGDSDDDEQYRWSYGVQYLAY